MNKKIMGVFLIIASVTNLTGCNLFKDPKAIIKTELIEPQKTKGEAYIVKKGSLKFTHLYKGVVKSKNIIDVTSTLPELVFDNKFSTTFFYVKKGDIIAQGYTNEIDNKIQTQNIQIQECESKVKMLKSKNENEYEVEKAELQLQKQQLILKELYEEREEHIFKSPIDGKILSITNAKRGDIIEKNKVIASIADDESKVVYAQIDSKNIRNYYPGMKVEIEYKNKKYEGEVKEVNLLDKKALRVERGVEVEFKDKMPKEIKLGDLLNCNAIGEEKENIIVIPFIYLKIDEFKNKYVYVIKNDVIEKRIIETGITDGRLIEIKSGLEIDESIF